MKTGRKQCERYTFQYKLVTVNGFTISVRSIHPIDGRYETSNTFDVLSCERNRSKEWKLAAVREKLLSTDRKLKLGEQEEGTYQTRKSHHLRRDGKKEKKDTQKRTVI